MTPMIDALYENLKIPASCYLGKKIFKKHFYEMDLSATDKNAFSQDIDKITWQYTLKPETINIAQYEDEEREYLEVAVIDVVLTSPKRRKRIAEIIQKVIPYPVLLIFIHGDEVALSVAEKRISRADSSKIMVEANHDTPWFIPGKEGIQEDFLTDFRVTNFSYHNFFDFYQDMVQRVIALNCAIHTGCYSLAGHSDKKQVNRLDLLLEIEKLQQERGEICNKVKKEKNMGTQVQLNSKVKQLSDRIEAIRSEL
jgi:hypothetical protein